MITFLPFIPFPVLYAETHYRVIPGIWSRLFRREPEIIADTVWRLDYGCKLPVLLLVKDAHLFPITIESISVELKNNGTIENHLICINEKIFHKFWWKIFHLQIPDNWSGNIINTDIKVHYFNNKNNLKICNNDNYRYDTPPLITYISKQKLPSIPGWCSADLHLHSSYTEDPIEFAAPIKATALMAKAIGLDVLAITDHSYDLGDSFASYMDRDPIYNKWNSFLSDVKQWNEVDKSLVVIPGQETTVKNNRGNSVHLQIFNHSLLLNGNSDSGKKWYYRCVKDATLKETTEKLLDTDTLVSAAHIGEKPPFLHRLLLGRDNYQFEDLSLDALIHHQIFNGLHSTSNQLGKKRWIEQLLSGKKKIPLAGSDSHANFNFARYILMPHISMNMSRKQLLGEIRTLIWTPEIQPGVHNIVSGIRKGMVQISNGPIFTVTLPDSEAPLFGQTKTLKEIAQMNVICISSSEFDVLRKFTVFGGINGDEITLKSWNFKSLEENITFPMSTEYKKIQYIRFELTTEKDFFSLSAPLFIA